MRYGTETEIRLMLLRHGETRFNEEKRYLGRGDEPLSEAGKEKLKKRKKELEKQNKPAFETFLVSSMTRCRQTAEILFPGRAFEPVEEWREIDFGLFEGKTFKELSGNASYQAWIDSKGTLPFPGGESRDAFKRRVTSGLFRLFGDWKQKEPEKSCYEAAAVVHGGTIMALLSSFWGGEYFSYQVPCGAGYICRFLCEPCDAPDSVPCPVKDAVRDATSCPAKDAARIPYMIRGLELRRI